MFVERRKIEKLLNERKLCTVDQFRTRSLNKRWKKDCYKQCYQAVFSYYGIVEDRSNERDKLIGFLNCGKDPEEDTCQIGPKRRHIDYSMAESDDDGGDIHDVSMDTVMSLDEPEEMLALKRQVIQLRIELKGLFE